MIRHRIAIPLLGLALALAVPALAQKGGAGPAPGGSGPVAQGSPAQTVAALPQEVAGFRRYGELTDFEQRPNGAGLGASVHYQPLPNTTPSNVTVYVYTAGLSGLPDGPDSPAVATQMQRMGLEVNGVARQLGNTLMGEAGGPVIQGSNGRPALRCALYMIRRAADGGQVDSYGCIGVVGGRFLKIRMTSSNPSAPLTPATVTAFGRGIVRALGG